MKRAPILACALMLAALPARAEPLLLELVFGLSRADGPAITEAEWQSWLDESLAPAAAGFTALDCQGGWFTDGRTVREGCKLVLMVAEPARLPGIEAAVESYKNRFKQQSVLWMQRPCAEPACRFR